MLKLHPEMNRKKFKYFVLCFMFRKCKNNEKRNI